MEDLEPLVTRCPHCSTRFRVSEAQLQMARGRVRCGACLTVFVGIDHLQWDLEQDVVAVNPDQSIDQLLGEIDEFESTAASTGSDAASRGAVLLGPDLHSAREEELVIEIELDEVTVPEPVAGAVPPVEAVESMEGRITQSVAGTEAGISESTEVTGYSNEAGGLGAVEQDREDGATSEPTAPVGLDRLPHDTIEIDLPADPFDRLWWDAAQEDRGAEPVEPERSVNLAEDQSGLDQVVVDPVTDQVERPADADRRAEWSGVALPNPPASNALTTSATAAQSLDGRLASVIQEVPAPSRTRRWRGVLIGLAIVLMTAQVIWYLLPSWISDPEKRWLPEQVCAIAGCKLEPLRDLTQLLLTNVVVRAHPEHPEVRQIDLLLVNSGTFDQAFPDIEITFSTPAGDRVAWKRFTPAQYLAGEMKNATAIPRKTPVRISLEVTDPGTLAYAYEITLK